MCGIIAITHHRDHLAQELYQGLNQLQHRGQNAAGLLTEEQESGTFHTLKGLGLLNQIVTADKLAQLSGQVGIGHVRYATSGTISLAETQPTVMTRPNGQRVALAFNGNLVNYAVLREHLLEKGVLLESNSDVSVLLHLLLEGMGSHSDPQRALAAGLQHLHQLVRGAYSLVGIVQGEGLFAFRDARGIRPLLMGVDEKGSAVGFASENYPLICTGFHQIEDLLPGTLYFVNRELKVSRSRLHYRPKQHCSFEYVYFAKANSRLEGKDVYQVRAELGRALARKVKASGLSVDVVMGVPSTSQPAAMAAAFALGVPLEEGFLRKDHTGRSFLMATQHLREKTVSQKLAPVSSLFTNRDILIVDDSIVRGTVSKQIVQMARECGARKVLFASTFPAIRYPCFYGIDIPNSDQLIAYQHSDEEVREAIGADHVIYNEVEDLRAAIGLNSLCMACITGSCPTSTRGVEQLQALREQHLLVQH